MPTIWQQKLLSILFLPSSIISIIGSLLIIRNIRQERRRTPYRSILLGTSICDIIATAGVFMQSFLPPANRPDTYVWAFGNDASCGALGAITQFSISAHIYAGVLSYYFLLTVRYGVKQRSFTKAMPYIHGSIITWSIVTSIIGLLVGAYGPSGAIPTCWVAGDGCEEDDCPPTTLIGLIFGTPAPLSLMSISVNNFLLYRFVRQTVMEGQKRGMRAEQELQNYRRPPNDDTTNDDTTNDERPHSSEFDVRSVASAEASNRASFLSQVTILTPTPKPKTVLRSSDKQWKKVQEVGKQSMLYVCVYLFCTGSSVSLQILDNRDYEYKKNAVYVFLPLLICQSIFLPLMGSFTCCIYFRPTYGRVRKKFPNQSRKWWIRRTLIGNSVKPVVHTTPNIASGGNDSLCSPTSILRVNFSGRVQRMSTLGPGYSVPDFSLIPEVDESSPSVHQ